jgi:uncharacterized secreted protein with C-terminal beta-propeller domain
MLDIISFTRGDSLLRKIALALIMVMLLTVVGCGGNEPGEELKDNANQSLNQEAQQLEPDSQMAGVDEDQALKIVENELGASSDADSKVYLLREAKSRLTKKAKSTSPSAPLAAAGAEVK